MRRMIALVTGGLMAGGVPLSALAQEAVPLDGVVVTTSKTPKKAIDAPSATSSRGSGGAKKAAAQRAPGVDAEEFPATVASIDGFGANGKSSFDRIQSQSITDVVRDVPGVTTSIAPNDPAQSINIRGLQDFGRVNVLIDGARQNFQRTGHNANGSFYLDPEFLSSIDITRGPSANIYGSGAIGGVAALNTKGIDDILRADEQSAVVQKLGIGSNGAGFLQSTSAGLRAGPNVDLFGQFVGRNTTTYENGDGVRIPDTGFEDFGGLGKIAVRPATGHEITATAMVQEYDFINSVASSPGQPPIRRDTDVGTETYTIGYTFARPDTPMIDFSAKAYYTSTDTDQIRLSNRQERSFEIETTGLDVANTSRFATGALRHRLTYGGDVFEDEVAVVDDAGSANLFTPGGKRTLYGAFIEDEIQVTSWLRAIGALRYDNFELESDDATKDGDRVSPKGTLAVTPIKGIELFGTYAEGYRAPALTETVISGVHPGSFDFEFLQNPDLDPEIGKTKEVGVNLQYDNVFSRGDKLRGKLAVYRNDVDDYIDLDFLFPPTCDFSRPFCVRYDNVARARIEGVEAELSYDWGGGFVNVAGTLNRSEDRATGLSLLTTQPDRLSTTLALRFFNGRLVAGTRLHFVDASVDDVLVPAIAGFAPSLAPTDGYTLVDLFGSYQFSEWASADMALNNITDVDYRKYLDQDDSAGFQARAALTVKFGGKSGPLSNW